MKLNQDVLHVLFCIKIYVPPWTTYYQSQVSRNCHRFWIFNEIDRYEKSFERMQAAYENCGRGGSAGDFPGDKLFDFG